MPDSFDADTLRRLLSRAAKDMPADERRRFRAFLAEQAPKPSKRRKVHSWKRKKAKARPPKISSIRVRAQLKLDLPNN